MTVTFPLNLDEASHFLKLSVEDRGADFVYEPPGGVGTGCLYWHEKENAPGCGVGDALFTAGVPAAALKAADKVSKQDTQIHKNPVLREFLEYDAIQYLLVFQGDQDESVPWGEAFEGAERVRERLIELHY